MSSTRPRLGRRRVPILIGLGAIIAAALLPAMAGAGAPQRHHLEFRLSGPDRQDVIGEAAIQIRARCLGEPCTVVATAKSKSPSFRTAKTRANLAAGEAKTLTLPLAKRSRAKLTAALESGHHPTLTVEAIAHDRSGTHVPLSLEVHVQNP